MLRFGSMSIFAAESGQFIEVDIAFELIQFMSFNLSWDSLNADMFMFI
ncbi:hypothetical protein Elgi_04370 [Paenibacillus elgii]|nr:hypothetical protein Elgi_04370 [Paenibacillus elgii]